MSLLGCWLMSQGVVRHVRGSSRVRPVHWASTLWVVGMLGLSGCASTGDDAGSEASFEPVARYVGTLPCDDCRLIRADLTLHRDPEGGQPERYFLQQTHVDATGGDFTSSFWGDWQLMPSDEAIFYRIEGEGRPIILRLEDEGERLGWAGVRESRSLDVSYELERTAPLR